MSVQALSLGINSQLSYVYIYVSKIHKIAYVGQTNSKLGVIGRAQQHLSADGTLRTKLEDIGLYVDLCQDLYLLSYPLPDERRFISTDSSYRLAVEYLVQTELHKIRYKLKPCFTLLSNITYTVHAERPDINHIAEAIIHNFVNIYKQL